MCVSLWFYTQYFFLSAAEQPSAVHLGYTNQEENSQYEHAYITKHSKAKNQPNLYKVFLKEKSKSEDMDF